MAPSPAAPWQRFAVAALPATPWKNGAGSTRTVACQPAGAGLEHFDWRVSVASIGQSGPFSEFAGVDRCIALLAGGGVHLHGPGIDHRLDTVAAPFAFAGELPVQATLLGAASTDCNVMTRRGVVRADVQAHRSTCTLAAAPAGVLLVLDGDWALQAAGTPVVLGAGQGLWWADATLAWAGHCATAGARLLSVRIEPEGK